MSKTLSKKLEAVLGSQFFKPAVLSLVLMWLFPGYWSVDYSDGAWLKVPILEGFPLPYFYEDAVKHVFVLPNALFDWLIYFSLFFTLSTLIGGWIKGQKPSLSKWNKRFSKALFIIGCGILLSVLVLHFLMIYTGQESVWVLKDDFNGDALKFLWFRPLFLGLPQ